MSNRIALVWALLVVTVTTGSGSDVSPLASKTCQKYITDLCGDPRHQMQRIKPPPPQVWKKFTQGKKAEFREKLEENEATRKKLLGCVKAEEEQIKGQCGDGVHKEMVSLLSRLTPKGCKELIGKTCDPNDVLGKIKPGKGAEGGGAEAVFRCLTNKSEELAQGCGPVGPCFFAKMGLCGRPGQLKPAAREQCLKDHKDVTDPICEGTNKKEKVRLWHKEL